MCTLGSVELGEVHPIGPVWSVTIDPDRDGPLIRFSFYRSTRIGLTALWDNKPSNVDLSESHVRNTSSRIGSSSLLVSAWMKSISECIRCGYDRLSSKSLAYGLATLYSMSEKRRGRRLLTAGSCQTRMALLIPALIWELWGVPPN